MMLHMFPGLDAEIRRVSVTQTEAAALIPLGASTLRSMVRRDQIAVGPGNRIPRTEVVRVRQMRASAATFNPCQGPLSSARRRS